MVVMVIPVVFVFFALTVHGICKFWIGFS